jgi:hypothetical protein
MVLSRTHLVVGKMLLRAGSIRPSLQHRAARLDTPSCKSGKILSFCSFNRSEPRYCGFVACRHMPQFCCGAQQNMAEVLHLSICIVWVKH